MFGNRGQDGYQSHRNISTPLSPTENTHLYFLCIWFLFFNLSNRFSRFMVLLRRQTMKTNDRCAHCRQVFIPNPRVKNQQYCDRQICQNVRKAKWQPVGPWGRTKVERRQLRHWLKKMAFIGKRQLGASPVVGFFLNRPFWCQKHHFNLHFVYSRYFIFISSDICWKISYVPSNNHHRSCKFL